MAVVYSIASGSPALAYLPSVGPEPGGKIMEVAHVNGSPIEVPPRESAEQKLPAGVEQPKTWFGKAAWQAIDSYAAKLGAAKLPKLLNQRERVRRELRAIPDRMQKITNQATLVLEMIDDYMDGKYRAISWTSMVVAAGALLYSVSPGDVVPDVVPMLGQLDDALVVGVAMRLIRRDLERYVAFKGYAKEKYF
jgi:uncharacterized membrane protein YkvA (DUF1232 family)